MVPTLAEAQSLWVAQTERWDCWLAALRTALRFWQRDYGYAELLAQLVGTPLRVSPEYGGYFPYLALIAAKLGFGGWLRCPLRSLPELLQIPEIARKGRRVRVTGQQLRDTAAQCRKQDYPRWYLYCSLALLRQSSSAWAFTVFKTVGRPSFQDVKHFLGMGMPVVVHVYCDEYYHLPDDDTGHLLTFIPVRDAPTECVILDGYRERGYRYFSQWERHLAAAKHYDWTRWSDWLLALQPNSGFSSGS